VRSLLERPLLALSPQVLADEVPPGEVEEPKKPITRPPATL
jgi:hypothetical protein